MELGAYFAGLADSIRMRLRSSSWLLVGAAIVTLACLDTVSPPPATFMVPPAKYRTLWRSVESCSGITRDFNAIDWFVTTGSAGARGDEDAIGSYWPDLNRIYLNLSYLNDDQVVRHEMLHALRKGNRHGPEFLEDCGGLVVCEGDCEREAGGRSALPTAASPVIAPSELEVTVTVLPPLPLEFGWATVIVAARNPSDVPVWVDLSAAPGDEFACLKDGLACTQNESGTATQAPFRAGETRRGVYVFQSVIGSYEIVGGYNSNVAPPVTLTVPPFNASRTSP